MALRAIIPLLLLTFACPVLAEEAPLDNPTDLRSPQDSVDTHPIYSTDTNWTGEVLVAVAGLFLAAVVIGPIVRAEGPQVLPAATPQNEDPPADRN